MGREQPPDGVLRVLIVTDDPVVRTEMQFGFPLDVTVQVAHDARDAWTLMQAAAPAVAIVDLQTGSAGGFGLARDMAADRHLRDVPVLMLLERDQDAWLADQAGARGHKTKPVEGMALVREALRLAHPGIE